MMIRTRFAPSPTGFLHIGGVRTALFSWAYARKHGGSFVLRIEDTDQERNIAGKDREILEILNLFGIEYQNVVYQSKNLKYHQQIAMQMLIQKKAFNCFCDEDKLESDRQIAKDESIFFSLNQDLGHVKMRKIRTNIIVKTWIININMIFTLQWMVFI